MTLLDTFDAAVRLTDKNREWGYVMEDGRKYPNYMTKEAFAKFLNEMKAKYQQHYDSFNKGNGGELKGKKYPPKMASAGSSSRMLYLLARDIEGFHFEVKRPTGVGGNANIDGYYQAKDGAEVYIEAKCREVFYTPYLKEGTVKAYKDIYASLKAIGIEYHNITKGKSCLFSVDGQELRHFDLKQTICHLLGIAKYQLQEESLQDKKVRFLYLIHELTEEEQENINGKYKEKISNAIQAEKEDISQSVCWRTLYKQLLSYQNDQLGQNKTKEEIVKMAKLFSFDLISNRMNLQDCIEGKIEGQCKDNSK